MLIDLQETQERIRKRIREDLKSAVAAHTDYEQDVFPKLKRSYLKKSQEVEVCWSVSYLAVEAHLLL